MRCVRPGGDTPVTAVDPMPSGPKPVTGGGNVTAAELQADDWARQAITERLPRLRAVATAWGATVTALTAIFGLATLTDSDAVVSKLDSPFDWIFGVSAALAAITAALAIFLASLAAQQGKKEIPPDLAERVRLYNETFENALNRLEWSRIWTGISIVFLIGNFAIRWYAPSS